MKLACNRSNLNKYASSLLGNDFTEEKKIELIKVCLNGFERNRGTHISHDQVAHLEKINSILGTYGVEGMLLDDEGNDVSGSCDPSQVSWDISYCNSGDTYEITILYINGKLCIGDWGSVVESIG